jgi:hypothetical protein
VRQDPPAAQKEDPMTVTQREQRRRWRSENELDPMRPLHRISWRAFFAVPLLVAVAAFGLAGVSMIVGSTLVTVFLFSFAVMTPVAAIVCIRQIVRRFTGSRS